MSEKTGKQIIEEQSGGWASCYICQQVFRRKRETARYCNECHHGYCEGEHGSFASGAKNGSGAKCIVCSTGGDPANLD